MIYADRHGVVNKWKNEGMIEKEHIPMQEKSIWRKRCQATVTWTFLKGGDSTLHINHLHFYKVYGSLLLAADILIK